MVRRLETLCMYRQNFIYTAGRHVRVGTLLATLMPKMVSDLSRA